MLDLLLVATWLTINMLWVHLTVLPKINNINSEPHHFNLTKSFSSARHKVDSSACNCIFPAVLFLLLILTRFSWLFLACPAEGNNM